MVNVSRPVKDVLLNCATKITKYKPEFQFKEFVRPNVDLAYVVNQAEIYEEIHFVGKTFAISAENISQAGTPYFQASVIDVTKLVVPIKIFGDLRHFISV